MAEHRLGKAQSLLDEGSMRKFEREGKAFVLARTHDRYFAFAANCSHWQGPLDQGVLHGETVMCPWHHACFELKTGARLEPPALNGIATYPVRLEDGDVVVTLTKADPPALRTLSSDVRDVVIVGGGAAGNSAAEELRRQGYQGAMTILSAASELPIDRPNVSKDYLAGKAKPEWMPLRDADWYSQRDIDLRLNTPVKSLNTQQHTLTLEKGGTVSFDRLLLATGGTPRRLPIPGADLKNVFTLRHQADADVLIEHAQKGAQVLIIGASFIGLEAAAALGERGLKITVVDMVKQPFERVFGAAVGKLFTAEHEKNGVTFHLEAGLERLEGENGAVTAATLKGGTFIPAEFVLMGVGVAPATDWLKDSGLAMDAKDRSLLVDTRLETSVSGIYAAGDIARFPDERGERIRIEHWRVAQQHGIVAARNMLNIGESVHSRVPFFWTNQWDLSVQMVGHSEKWDSTVMRGSLDQREFIVFYLEGGDMRAAAASNRDTELDALEWILKLGKPLTPAQMRDPAFDLVAYSRA